VRLALCESLLLSIAAGALGLLVARALLETFVAIAPAGMPKIAEASLDARVFAVAILLVAITGVAVGLWPALSVFRIGGLQALRSTRAASAGARPRARFGLVTAQIALTVALLGGSALLLRSIWNLVALPLGFEAGQVVTLTVRLGAAGYPTPEQRAAFFDALLAAARATPGAMSAALSDAPAPRGLLVSHQAIAVEGSPRAPGARHPAVRMRSVTPQYFETFGIGLVGGRTFVESDRQDTPLAAILTESAARALFGTRAATGRRIRIESDSPWLTVVGVVRDIRNGPDIVDDPQPELYLVRPRGELRRSVAHLALRATMPPADAGAFLRRIAADLDPTLPVTIETGGEQVARLTERPRFVASLLAAFAALALTLAAAGLYSVASYLVAQRTNEIGVRIALGAAPSDVARQVVGEAGRWISAGALLGCALGWIGSFTLHSQLYGIEALDPWSWMAALLALALALAVAVVRPAFAAARVDPIAALRSE
jgi:predicted permease